MSLSSVSQIWAEVAPALWLVTARAGDAEGGMIATFVNQASIAPEFPRMLVGLSHQHHTRQLVETSGPLQHRRALRLDQLRMTRPDLPGPR